MLLGVLAAYTVQQVQKISLTLLSPWFFPWVSWVWVSSQTDIPTATLQCPGGIRTKCLEHCDWLLSTCYPPPPLPLCHKPQPVFAYSRHDRLHRSLLTPATPKLCHWLCKPPRPPSLPTPVLQQQQQLPPKSQTGSPHPWGTDLKETSALSAFLNPACASATS